MKGNSHKCIGRFIFFGLAAALALSAFPGPAQSSEGLKEFLKNERRIRLLRYNLAKLDNCREDYREYRQMYEKYKRSYDHKRKLLTYYYKKESEVKVEKEEFWVKRRREAEWIKIN